MQLDEAQGQLLKSWVIKKLDASSDTAADPDVLADYVLELVRGNEDPEAVRKNCIDNLKDFLQDSTERFVDDFVKAVQTKSYDPTQPPPTLPAPRLQPPSGPRKRAFDDRDDDNAVHGRLQSQDRPVKQLRRGGRGGFDRGVRQGQPQWQTSQYNNDGMATMSPQAAMDALLAMQQAFGLQAMPGMPQYMDQTANAGAFAPRRSGQRCRDYDSKGFCTRGASCRFEHGTEAVVVGGQEHNTAMLPHPGGQFDSRGRAGDRGRGGRTRGNGRRADFSLAGPSQDHSLTALVIEQIPEDKFDEGIVRDFFNQYGTIQNIEMQPYKRLAIVTFDSWDEANAAYTSPKVIFDNRFVKVFWYKPGANTTNGHHVEGVSEPQDTEMKTDEPQINLEEVAKRQEEAQKKHEAAKQQRDEAQKQKSEIDAKLKAMEEERKKFADLLAKKAKPSAPAQIGTDSAAGESEQTKGLKAQLAKLEAEAKSLGLDPDTTTSDAQNGQTWRGRGGLRGRGGRFPTRGAFRGGWAATSARGGAVKRLDNRPKTLAIQFSTGTFDQYEEALRQYLLFSDNLEHAMLSRHPDRADAAMVAFEERYRAEKFMAAVKGPTGIPNMGAVEVSWMANPAKPVANGTSSHANAMVIDAPQSATAVEREADYDVAEDDQWI